MRAAIGLWVRNEVGRRWKALVALGLLAGLVGGLAIAAVAGARRTETAYERFREATGRADAILFATQLQIEDADYAAVRALPEVEDAGEFGLAFPRVEGYPTLGSLVPNDDHLYRTIAAPLLVKGRLPDPNREDEVVVDLQAASQLGLGVGDHLRITAPTELFNPDAPGPTVDATVVGVGDSMMNIIFGGTDPGFVPSAALLAHHPEVPSPGNLVVRLRPGTDVAAFARRAADAMGLPNLPVRDLAEDSKRVTHGTDLERAALLLFAAAAALAGVVLVGQALTRTVYALAEPVPALRALGFTRAGLAAGLALPLAVTAAAGVATAVVTAVGLSRWFPLGLAGRLEPDRGLHADWLVIVPGTAAVVVAVLVGAVASAWRATSVRPGSARGRSRYSPLTVLGRVAPLPTVIGAGLALERGEGTRALPVRPALVGAVTAVLGVVGAFGLLHGMDDALARPDRSGQFWDIGITGSSPDAETAPLDEILSTISADAQVAEASYVQFADVDVADAGLPIYALRPTKGKRTFTLLTGHRPEAADEVVIGPATAKALHRGIGDTIHIGGPEGPYVRVVGTGLLPQTPHFSFDQGLWMSDEGLDAVGPPIEERQEYVLVRFVPGTAVEKAAGSLVDRLGPGLEVDTVALPQDVAYLRNLRTLPTALAAFLVLLGLGAVGHVLASAVRRRRHDLAVLRALGFRPVQAAACVAWQAVTVTFVALVLGIPLGIAAGRWSWRWVADATPLLYVPPVAATVVLLSIPTALVLANLMAALPARRAARLRPADVLRTE